MNTELIQQGGLEMAPARFHKPFDAGSIPAPAIVFYG